MRTFDVQSIEIQAPPAKVFAFVREPSNLPKWALAFKAADSRTARLEMPAGAVDIALEVNAHEAAGTVDWRMQFPDKTVGIAQSRVTPTSRGTSIFSFVLHAPPVPLEQVEGALDQQMSMLRKELVGLKSLLEM